MIHKLLISYRYYWYTLSSKLIRAKLTSHLRYKIAFKGDKCPNHKRGFTSEINNIDLVNNMSDDLNFMTYEEIRAIIYNDDVIKRLLSSKQIYIKQRSLYIYYHLKRVRLNVLSFY